MEINSYRIAVITSSYPRFKGDSTAPFVKSICDNLSLLGHHIAVVAPYDPAVKKTHNNKRLVTRFKYIWPDTLSTMGYGQAMINDNQLKLSSYFLLPFFLIAGIAALFQITKYQNSDIIHAHWVIPNGLIASIVSKLRKIPFVISLHGSDIFLARRNFLYRYITKWVFKNASGVTACSPGLKKIALSIETNQNVELIPYGADPNLFKRAHLSSLNLERMEPNSVELIITSLGRLVHKKGFDILLEAFSNAIKEIPQLKLIIGGDGTNRNALNKKSVDLGIENDVKFVGNVPWDTVPYFLSKSDIFILPSIVDPRGNVDGLPNVLLEAMSCENAVIASDVGGVSMVIEHYKTGILVKPGDIEQLTNSILILAKDKEFRTRLGIEARKSIIENFNWQNTAKKIEDLIIQVITQ